MRIAKLLSSLFVAVCGLSACAAAPAVPRALAPSDEPGVRIEVFREDLELGELEHDIETIGELDEKDVERVRTGARFHFGRRVSGYFQIFKEDFESRLLPTTAPIPFDTYGVGGGVNAAPVLGGSSNAEFTLPFKAGLNVAAGVEDGNVGDEELVYLDLELEVGLGMNIRGLRPSIGVYADALFGLHESDDPADPSHLEPTEISGFNLGPYAELAYLSGDFPLYARVRVLGGDVEGVTFALGVAF